MSTRAKWISSQVLDIARLSFYPLPSRPTKIAKAMRVDNHYVMLGENGRIYTSQARNPTHWTTTQRMAPTIKALIAFGVLSEQAVKQHNDAQEAERLADRRRWAAASVLDNLEWSGIKLTAAQTKKLHAAAKGGAS